MLISTLAIAGVPLFSGFLSKDAILAGTLSFANHNPQHFLLPVFGFGAALLTAFYMFRLIFMTFHNEPNKPELIEDIYEKQTFTHIYEANALQKKEASLDRTIRNQSKQAGKQSKASLDQA